MNLKRVLETASAAVFALLILGTNASANQIAYTTNTANTKFVVGNIGGTGQTLNSTGGVSATLVFTPNASSISGTPSNINYGDFQLTCAACTTTVGTTFGAFTFDLVITDTTDGGTGQFVGTSSGGNLFSNSSTVAINWSPLQVGPGGNNAQAGDFGPTSFTIPSVTSIIALNSGTPPGDTLVQGAIASSRLSQPRLL